MMEFAGVIVTLAFRNKLQASYESGFLDVFNRAYRQNNTEAIKMIENLERQFGCCGVNNLLDYAAVSVKIPTSCYPKQSLFNLPYSKGCASAVTDWMQDALPAIAGALGTILFIEIFGIIAALVLGVAISHARRIEVYAKL